MLCDGKTQDVFEATADFKSALTWSDLTEIFLCFTHSLKENVVADLLLGVCTYSYPSSKHFFICYKKLLPKVPEHAVYNIINSHIKKNSVALVRERTIPTERPPPVGEVSANFCG